MPKPLLLALMCLLSSPALAEEDSLDRDYGAELPRIPATAPDKVGGTFVVREGFRMDLVAAEPLVRDPVAMAFDADGRMFVVDMTGYSEERTTIPCTVQLLEDTDNDGVYDKRTPYVEGLEWAVAVACYDGGVFVGVPPDILYARDNDGDGRADQIEKVYTGFALSNVQGLMNTFLWGLDHRIHGATSSSGGNVVPAANPAAAPIPLGGRDFSFDPRTRDFRAENGGAQHGQSFDQWGRKYTCSNSDHLQWVWYEDRYAARNPRFVPPAARESIAADGPAATVYRISPVEPWREVRTRLRVKGLVPGPVEGGGRAAGYFTSATGVTIYQGDAWPAEYRGQAFIGDVGGNLIHRKRIEEDGLNLHGIRADEGREFIASTDIWFRPVQFANAPDGCLYAADMYREVIEHPASLPEIIKKHLDLNSGNDMGRIYRIAPEGFKAKPLPKLSQYATADLVPLLAHPNAWHWETAARLIFERQDASVVPALQSLLKESDSGEGRLHALYALSGLNALDETSLTGALNDPCPAVRAHALRISEDHMNLYAVQAEALKRVSDDNPWVRLQAAWSLGAAPEDERLPALATLAHDNTDQPRVRAAVLCSAGGAPGRLAAQLAADAAFADAREAGQWLAPLARMAGATHESGEAAAVLGAVERLDSAHAPLAEGMLLALYEGGPVAGATTGGATGLLARLIDEARTTLPDTNAKAEARAQAVRVLRAAPEDQARPLLLAVLTPQTPDAVQDAALEALSRMDSPEVAQALLAAWSGFGPARRAQAVEVLFRRPDSIRQLLAAIRAGSFRSTDLDSIRVHALLNHEDTAIRAEAGELLAKNAPSNREDVVARYRPALDRKGDPKRGAPVFETNCSPCHQVRGVGNNVGPNLATVVQAGAEKILLNVLDPNREVNPQYVNYTVETGDFETHTGIIAAETASNLTLKRAHGDTDVIARADIQSIRSEALSIMPEGFEATISIDAMADLIAYLTASE